MKRFFIFIAVLMLTLPAAAQEAFSSYTPYSLFGIGQLESVGDQNTAGMGGIGVGLRDPNLINLLNPAAVTAREADAFMLDFGLKQSNMVFAGADAEGKLARSAKNLFNIDHVVVSFPIYKSSAFRVGVMPFSNTGYAFTFHEDKDQILATLGDVQYFRSGQGGINQVFAGAGVTLFDRLSVGADGLFYIGTIRRSTTTYFNTNEFQRSATRAWNVVPRGFSAKAGIQYEQPVGEDMSLTVGATYKIGSTLKGDFTDVAYASGGNYVDTTLNNSYSVAYSIPQEIAAGFTFRKSGSWMFGFDYTRQDWTGSKFDDTPGVNFSAGLAQSFNAGFEIIPNRYDVRYYFRTVTYRIGAYHKTQYIMIDGNQVATNGITLGFALPVYNRRTSVSFAVDLGQTSLAGVPSVTTPGNVRERYVKFSLGLNLYDIWFQKVLYN
ncbi:MAG: hypothetical protein IKX60_06625 [Bacteroidales bacterium]|nr:hypothetical protein [Bacteroidales bacterium]